MCGLEPSIVCNITPSPVKIFCIKNIKIFWVIHARLLYFEDGSCVVAPEGFSSLFSSHFLLQKNKKYKGDIFSSFYHKVTRTSFFHDGDNLCSLVHIPQNNSLHSSEIRKFFLSTLHPSTIIRHKIETTTSLLKQKLHNLLIREN